MTHDEIKQKLYSLYDGPGIEKERELAENHLLSCTECRKEVGEWRKITSTLFAPPALSEADEDLFVSRTMAHVRAAAKTLPFWSREPFGWLVPLFACAIVAAWVLLFTLPRTPGLQANTSTEMLFQASDPQTAPSMGGVVPVSYSTEDRVVSFIKE